MRKNIRTTKVANIPAQENNNRSIVEKFTDLAVFDFKTAAVISRFISRGCLFCELTHLCSDERKKIVLKDSDDGFSECCKGFQLSFSRCERAIASYLEDHPEYKQEVIRCKTTTK